ncbi:MAG: DUF4276 family protein [Bryobacteraceae bacterium]
MPRLIVYVEGQTEEVFVNELLQKHLLAKGYWEVSPRLMGKAGVKRGRGGVRSWPTALEDIVTQLKQDPTCFMTTMVDYYGMPAGDGVAWPGRIEARRLNGVKRALAVENALRIDVAKALGKKFDANRFIPFVVLHEFEGLLFSDCSAFSRAIGRSDLEAPFTAIRETFLTPEDINDSKSTAPSKRIEKHFPGYRRQKPFLGPLAASTVGLQRIRKECPHFNDWLTTLEKVPS